ncbi:hypothetical protein GIB67_017421 [Kingdonia uniflora]|uniref:Uncharacterized protein n=1 Tax=Kingdonia uniflora TaxID=39325 RepID=A0A7J7M4J4_9MAGN|nr:hypothetical protein GIB67_017421 [Kingdonia uniflora]
MGNRYATISTRYKNPKSYRGLTDVELCYVSDLVKLKEYINQQMQTDPTDQNTTTANTANTHRITTCLREW